MFGQSKKFIFGIAGGIVLVSLIASGFIFYSGQQSKKVEQKQEVRGFQFIAEDGNKVLMADTGLDIEWLDGDESKGKQVFERYRVVSKEDFESYAGNENTINTIDISSENAAVFLTSPDGKSKEIASDIPYIKFSVLPPMPVGKHKLNINLNSGETYEFKFEFKQPSETEFVNTGKTITQVKPTVEEGKILTAKEQRLFDNLELTEKESRTLYAFKLGNLDLRDADKVFHMTPEGATYGGGLAEARDIVDIDEYFWLDIEDLNLKQTERNEFIQIARELENIDPDVAYELERLENSTDEHTFLAKIKGVWYYATVSPPF